MIMGGWCRLCYHGMARVIPQEAELPPFDETVLIKEYQLSAISDICGDGTFNSIPHEDIDTVKEYLSTHRININLRQVLTKEMSEVP